MSFLSPDYQYETIHDVEFTKLRSNGIKFLMIDIDNTIVPWDSDKVEKKIIELFKYLEQIGFTIMLLSNAKKDRVEKIAEILKVDGIAMALKPLPMNLKKCYKAKGFSKNQVVMIGDQMFTDLLGAKLAGVKAILIDPLSEKELKLTKFMRLLEAFIRKNSD